MREYECPESGMLRGERVCCWRGKLIVLFESNTHTHRHTSKAIPRQPNPLERKKTTATHQLGLQATLADALGPQVHAHDGLAVCQGTADDLNGLGLAQEVAGAVDAAEFVLLQPDDLGEPVLVLGGHPAGHHGAPEGRLGLVVEVQGGEAGVNVVLLGGRPLVETLLWVRLELGAREPAQESGGGVCVRGVWIVSASERVRATKETFWWDG